MTKRKEESERIAIADCIKGRVYEIQARSLGPRAVYNGREGFVGLRQEIWGVGLFTESHWDQGPPFGTVYCVRDTGIDLPDGIDLSESPGTIDESTGRWVYFKAEGVGVPGKWYFCDNDEWGPDIRPVGKRNDALYDWLWENGANEKHWDRP